MRHGFSATNGRALGVAGVAALLLSSSAPALSQSASQITPRSFEPAPPPPQSPPDVEGLARPAPVGSETAMVTLGSVDLVGGALDPDVARTLRARLIGKRVSVAEIFAATGNAETAEAKRGRVLVRLSIPPQSFADGGALRVVVTIGFIERVDVSAVPRRVRGRVEALLRSLIGRRDVTLALIERKLTLAGDLPGVALRSTLAPGQGAGAVVLRIDATWRPVTGFASVDNLLSDQLGRESYALGLDVNSVLRAGELLYLRASGLPNAAHHVSFLDKTPRNRALAAGLVVPLGTDGLAFTLEATDARTAPRHDGFLLGIGSRFRRLSYRLRYPIVRERALTVATGLSLDAQDDRARIIEPLVLPLSRDKLRIVRAAADANAYVPGGGTLSARMEVSFGLDALGARSAADAPFFEPFSRFGADDDLRKLTVAAAWLQPVVRHVDLSVEGRAQTSFGKPLPNSEQFGVASPDAISPVPSGLLQGDGGHVVRGEARSPWFLARPTLIASVAPYVFVAQAEVRIAQATVVERPSIRAFAYGAGLRLQGQAAGGTPGLSVGVEYGRVRIAGWTGDRATFSVFGRF